MKFAVLGSGGREHAIAWKLAREHGEDNVFVLPGNGGTPGSVAIDPADFAAVARFCREHLIDLVIVGPESLLDAGAVNELLRYDVRVFGPTREAARMESSKLWSKKFMARHGVATGRFMVARNAAEIVPSAGVFSNSVAIKYDGLAAGKGVVMCENIGDVTMAAEDLAQRFGSEATYVVEERLEGWELSLLALTDGICVVPLLPIQDHKRLLDGDCGPNTGGMGAYCPVAGCDDALMESIRTTIIEPTLAGIKADKLNYRGVIYFGIMVTEQGPKLLEYNVRFGDPETQVVLAALQDDFGELLMSCVDGVLSQHVPRFSSNAFVTVVLAAEGYPQNPQAGMVISGLNMVGDSVLVFHAGTVRDAENALCVKGGRVLNVVGCGPSLAAAREVAYGACNKIHFAGMQYRRDIGAKGM